MQASEKATADQKVFEEFQRSEMARVAKERAVALAELERDQQLAIQNERKQQEIMAAEVARRQMVELAEQQRQVKVLQEQQKRESADKERLVVSAQREDAAQAVETVKATQAAERDAHILVIAAEREAQQAMIAEKNKIELEALRRQRDAEARAVALREMTTAEAAAALKQAETLRTQAQAEVEAEKLRADGARAKASAAGLAEAEVLSAKADAAMREAEAIRAKGLAEAESAKAKAEALAAFDGVQQRVEIARMQLDAQVRIEVARAEALGTAVASMNIKMIGDPAAAATLLRMVTLSDGLGEVLNAAPQPVRALGQQVINKLTGNPNGDGLLNLPAANGHDLDRASGIAELSNLVPQVVELVEQHLDVDVLTGQTVGQVLGALVQKVGGADRATVERAQRLVGQLPLINDLPFEEVYLRAAETRAAQPSMSQTPASAAPVAAKA